MIQYHTALLQSSEYSTISTERCNTCDVFLTEPANNTSQILFRTNNFHSLNRASRVVLNSDIILLSSNRNFPMLLVTTAIVELRNFV